MDEQEKKEYTTDVITWLWLHHKGKPYFIMLTYL